MVKIYSTETCPYCELAKKYFSKINVEYQEFNVQKDEESFKEMVKKSSQMGVPVIDIDGTIIVGFDREAIDHALGIADHQH
ncbi:MAG: glutaredoxin domain-containing protein [Candidatus Paceibacterota bacterium]|jgi:glutaredoxin-like YruB-family protein